MLPAMPTHVLAGSNGNLLLLGSTLPRTAVSKQSPDSPKSDATPPEKRGEVDTTSTQLLLCSGREEWYAVSL